MTTKRNKTAINTQCIQIQICFLSVSCSCLPDIVNTDFIIWICNYPLIHVKCVADNLSYFSPSFKATLCQANNFTQTPTAVCRLMTLRWPIIPVFVFISTTGILVRAGITLQELCYTAERFIAQQGNVSYCHRCCCLQLFIWVRSTERRRGGGHVGGRDTGQRSTRKTQKHLSFECKFLEKICIFTCKTFSLMKYLGKIFKVGPVRCPQTF